jgi:hypothetical protein
MGQNDAFMERLVDDLRPVQVMRLSWLLPLWLTCAVCISLFFVHSVGVRPDLAAKLTQPSYVLSLGLLIVAYFMATWSAIAGSIPGRLRRGGRWLLATFAVYGVSLTLYSGLLTGGRLAEPFVNIEALFCCLRITYGTVFLNLLALSIMSRLAPMNPTRVLIAGMASSMFIVSFVSQLECPYDDIGHVLTGHGLLTNAAAAALFAVYWGLFRYLTRLFMKRRTGLAEAIG